MELKLMENEISPKNPLRMIVNSKNLAFMDETTRLDSARLGLSGTNRLLINGSVVGECDRMFDGFFIPDGQYRRLKSICRQLLEQPVTLVFDGEHFWLEHFKI